MSNTAKVNRDAILAQVRALPSPIIEMISTAVPDYYRQRYQRSRCTWCHAEWPGWRDAHPANDCLWYRVHQPLAAEPVSPAPAGAGETSMERISEWACSETPYVVGDDTEVNRTANHVYDRARYHVLALLPAASSEADPGRSGLPVRMPTDAPSGASKNNSAPRSASLDAAEKMADTREATMRIRLVDKEFNTVHETSIVPFLGYLRPAVLLWGSRTFERARHSDVFPGDGVQIHVWRECVTYTLPAETPASEPTPLLLLRVRDALADFIAHLNRESERRHAHETFYTVVAEQLRQCVQPFWPELLEACAQSAPVVAAPAPTRDLHAAFREVFSQAELDELADAAVAAPAETPTWQPMETAPKDGTWVLLRLSTDAESIPDVGNWFDTRDGGWWQSHSLCIRPIAWAPLPAPPSGAPTP